MYLIEIYKNQADLIFIIILNYFESILTTNKYICAYVKFSSHTLFYK
jgi:hypothetical protein